MSQPPDDEAPFVKRPLFLTEKASESEYVEDPDAKPDFTAIDEEELLPEPDSALKPRHKEVARLHALGRTNNQIASQLGYSYTRISVLLKTAAIRAEVDRYRNRLYEQDVLSAIKDLGSEAVRVIEEILLNPKEKSTVRAEQARWILEKMTGKAKQEVNVESNTLAAFMDMLKQMQQGGESLEPLDVTPKSDGETGTKALNAPAGDSKFTKWVDSEL